jgi:hypothetical protein
MVDSSIIPCEACGATPTNKEFHNTPLCAECRSNLLINCVPGETPAKSRIEQMVNAYAELRRRTLGHV